MNSANKKVDGESENIFEEALIPSIPEDLWKEVEDKWLSPDNSVDVTRAKEIAPALYEKWRDNSFEGPEITSFFGTLAEGRTPCSDLRLHEQVDFDADYPHAEDYDGGESSLDYEIALAETNIKVARAQKICGECPFQIQCLFQSVKVRVGTRKQDRGDLLLNHEDGGLWGGYGYNARKVIFREMVALWNEDPEAPATLEERMEFVENQAREREQAMIRARNELRKERAQAVQGRAKAARVASA